MRTAYAEWWHDGESWVRYGTEQDPITFFLRDHAMVPGAPEHGYVYADTCAEAMRVDAEVFGCHPEAGR